MSNIANQYAEEEYAKDVKNIRGKSKKKNKRVSYDREDSRAIKVTNFDSWKRRVRGR